MRKPAARPADDAPVRDCRAYQVARDPQKGLGFLRLDRIAYEHREDYHTPVSPDYPQHGNQFTGTIKKIIIELK